MTEQNKEGLESVRALTFDVFGTVTNWRTSIIAEGRALGEGRFPGIDWEEFALAWRAGYAPAMDQVRRGKVGWKTIDQLHRQILVELVDRYNIELSEAEIDSFNRVWHRLRPWPDAPLALPRLRRKYVVSTLSNGNVSLLAHMARHAGLDWDLILSAELFGHYKPDPEVYQGAARLLDLKPNQVMMVAAHEGDLRAAAAIGMRTAYVHRPLEYGALEPKPWPTAQDDRFDVMVFDMVELCEALAV